MFNKNFNENVISLIGELKDFVASVSSEVDDLRKEHYNNIDSVREDVGEIKSKIGWLKQKFDEFKGKTLTSDSFITCKSCGVVVRKTKAAVEPEPTIDYDGQEPERTYQNTYYCQRCYNEKDEIMLDKFEEELIEIDRVGEKLAKKIINQIK
ncbi:MAG: hypothetical protein ACOC5T_07510 [Elusimicrobiota bacterium]